MALNLADLLKCARQAVAMVMEAGVRGQLPESHMTFLEGVNKSSCLITPTLITLSLSSDLCLYDTVIV